MRAEALTNEIEIELKIRMYGETIEIRKTAQFSTLKEMANLVKELIELVASSKER